MIGVIADDLSGAAEIAGLAYRYGLDSVVRLEPSQDFSSEKLCVWDTDSRSCTAKEAEIRVEKTASELLKKNPDWIYKKVDSVLRGHIAVELDVLNRVFEQTRTILIPANPSLGRTIKNGHYYVHGQPLEETDFIDDPELMAKTSKVVELLGPAHKAKVVYGQAEDFHSLPAEGIICGDAATTEDIIHWTAKLDELTLPAGGSDFFTAILEKRGFRLSKRSSTRNWPTRTLLISGSASKASGERIAEAESEGIPVCRMPEKLMQKKADAEKLIEEWENRVALCLRENDRVIVTIGKPRSKDSGDALRLGEHLCELTRRLMKKEKIEHLCIEGGATASRIIRRQKWNCLQVIHEWTRGVVSMKIQNKSGPILTIKPGSYPWPSELLEKRCTANN